MKKLSQQRALRQKAGWNFSSAAKNGKVQGEMLLQLKDQVIQTDKRLDYKVSPGYFL